MRKLFPTLSNITCGILCLLLLQSASAQSDVDAIMIRKNYFCSGAMYSHSSWKNYWEGTFKRNNQNLGTVSTQVLGIIGNYGITNKLNVLFGLPYVTTNASGGTLKGMKGLQDLSFTVKWKPFEKQVGQGTVSLFALGGVSFPVTNYVADFQPMAIGMHSRNATVRGMADYQLRHFFVTVSGMYTRRSNINIDRTAYYTTEMHYTNEVKMPDMAGFNIRTGFRNREWIAEAVVDNFTTMGGFDIRKNDMPFPSNKMNGTRAGVNFKYSFTSIRGLELTAGGNHIIAGRNIGQSNSVNAGAFYLINLTKKKKTQS